MDIDDPERVALLVIGGCKSQPQTVPMKASGLSRQTRAAGCRPAHSALGFGIKGCNHFHAKLTNLSVINFLSGEGYHTHGENIPLSPKSNKAAIP